jgi:LPXTG-motif cell wall-anchored protein
MKGINILYWTFTVLLTVFMLLGAIPDLLRIPDAVSWLTHLGYPAYLLPFLGFAKVLGLTAILFPRLPRLKEWAFAGLAFDLIGALYSHLSVGDAASSWIFPVIGIVLLIGSYVLFRRKTQAPVPVADSTHEVLHRTFRPSSIASN